MKTITDEEAKLVDQVKDQLMEHFDTVRILVTKHDGTADETDAYSAGVGNLFAQQGVTEDWLDRQKAKRLDPEEEEE